VSDEARLQTSGLCVLDGRPATSWQEARDGTGFALCSDCTHTLEHWPLWRPCTLAALIEERLVLLARRAA
jgi:hypothetical protein